MLTGFLSATIPDTTGSPRPLLVAAGAVTFAAGAIAFDAVTVFATDPAARRQVAPRSGRSR